MSGLQRAYFGIQCFWHEDLFAQLRAVRVTTVGYAGGTTADPTYENIGDHTEIVEVQYDHAKLSFKDLLDFFWSHHKPSERHKKQYQSAILYVTDEQKEIALASRKDAAKKFKFVETYVEKLDTFYPAENYHQKYWLRSKKEILDKLALTDEKIACGELATKINAWLRGYANFCELGYLMKVYNLTWSAVDAICQYVEEGGDRRICSEIRYFS